MNIYENIAKELNIDPALVFAITRVESHGVFSYKNGKIPLLVERHKIYKYIKRQYSFFIARKLAKKYPQYINPKAGGYTSDEYKRLTNAIKYITRELAKITKNINVVQATVTEIVYKSTSWGAFQTMGFNHKLCGYKTAVKMAEAYHQNPKKAQIKAFIKFIKTYKNGKVLKALKQKNWQKVAYHYNGSGYKRNNYDKKLQAAYNSYLI